MQRAIQIAKRVVCAMCATACTVMVGCGSDGGSDGRLGMVYAGTNGAGGNEVIAFRRGADGNLTRVNAYTTGGNGTGTTEVSPATPQDGIDPLASQGSLALSRDGQFLFIVNAGAGSVSSFRVEGDGTLTRVDHQTSGGAQPNSLDSYGNLLYVSHVGNTANGFDSNVTGFRIESDGSLTPIAGSTRKLSTANAQPSRVAFTPNGSLLVVSELTTNKVTSFPVNADGTLGTMVVNNSSGPGPFGSIFLSSGRLLVTEANPGGIGALSSYNVSSGGTLSTISGSVPSGQMATCWVVTSRNELYAYTSNTASHNLSRYTVNNSGAVALAQGVASGVEGAGSGPIDMGVTEDGQNLYALNGGNGSITAHLINSDGSLTRVGAITGQGLPTLGAQGLAAR
jgi:6-phosphogluconolactonase